MRFLMSLGESFRFCCFKPCWAKAWLLWVLLGFWALPSALAAGFPGDVDLAFQPRYPAQRGIIRQDGHIVVAGDSVVTVVDRNGSLVSGPYFVPASPYSQPSEMGLLADGSVIGGFDDQAVIGGDGTTIAYLLTPDGDFSTWPLGGAASRLAATHFSPMPDGRIAVAGYFIPGSTLFPQTSELGMLNPDLSFERSSIIQCTGGRASRAGQINGILQVGDGRYFAYGYFTRVGTEARNAIARLLPSGAVDASFKPALGLNSSIWSAAFDQHGRILVGGWLALPSAGNVAVARLMADGSLDPTFTITTGSPQDDTVLIRTLGVDSQQRIVVSGVFESLNGVPLPGMARLLQNGALDTTFLVKQPLVNRLGGGAHDYPQYLVDGSDDIYGFGGPIDAGILAGQETLRISGGGQAAAAPSVPIDSRRVTVGEGVPLLLTAPGLGNPVPIFQWWRNGIPIVGATNPSLSLYNVSLQDAGSYRVTASNQWGTIDRQVAVVAVSPVAVSRIAGVDLSFRSPSNMTAVAAMAALEDESLVVAFSYSIGATQGDPGEAVHGIRHLFRNGAIDSGFWTRLGLESSKATLACSLVPLSNGKLIVGGNFVTVNGQLRRSIVRLLADGTVDPTFRDFGGTTGIVNSVLATPGGKILVGGQFSTFHGVNTGPLVSLLEDGTLDPEFVAPSFNPGETISGAWPGTDGGALLQATTTVALGSPQVRLVRVGRYGGSLESFFTPAAGVSNLVTAPRPDGRVVISTSVLTNRLYSQLSFLLADGTTDPDLPEPVIIRGRVSAMATDRNSRILVGGSEVLTLSGRPPRFVVRLTPEANADSSFDLSALTSRLASSRPPLLVTAAGRVVVNTAQGLAIFQGDGEILGPPEIVGSLGDQDYEVLPSGQSAAASSVSFTAPVRGSALVYQWFFEGAPLDGENRATLTVSKPQLDQLGSYSVVVSNLSGVVTSTMARLRAAVALPQIIKSPVDRVVVLGQRVDLSLAVQGGWPMRVDWYHEGRLLTGLNHTNLLIQPVTYSDAGLYRAVVTNPAGSVGSAVFRLSFRNGPLLIGDAVDAPDLVWVGAGDWKSLASDTSDGVDAAVAMSSGVADAANCDISVVGPGSLTFQWKVETISPSFTFELLLDSQRFTPKPGVDSFASPATEWAAQSIRIPAGFHVLSWRYRWSSSAFRLAFLDQVKFVPDSPQAPVILTQPLALNVIDGGSARLAVSAYSLTPLSFQWRKDGLSIPGAAEARFDMIPLLPSSSGEYDVVVSNTSGSVTSQVARVMFIPADPLLPLPLFDSKSRVSLSIPAETVTKYRLESSDDLERWTDVAVWFLPIEDGIAEMIDPSLEGSDRKFYRLAPLK
jgi:uncharacterized delta-60 repeat protein